MKSRHDADAAQPSRIDHLLSRLDGLETIRVRGRLHRLSGHMLESIGPAAKVGDVCEVHAPDGSIAGRAEVVGFNSGKNVLMPLHELEGIAPGGWITNTNAGFSFPVGDSLLGRVLDAYGNPLDGRGLLYRTKLAPVLNTPPHPISRRMVDSPFVTGIRSLDGMLTFGKGQRVGIFAGSGVGKSVLIGMIARKTRAQVNVIALIGERGREVREFIEFQLGEEGLRRSVVIVVTSDQPAMARIKGALAATTVAEHFRDQGMDVLLMMDSLTRVAMAQREIGLAAGEPPTARGYTPSCFTFLPKLLERAGAGARGSITGIYTVLVEGDDLNDPVGDAARGLLDGHVVLSRRLSHRGHYPAIEVLASVSRVMQRVIGKQHYGMARRIQELMAVYAESEDLILLGAYAAGTNPVLDQAIKRVNRINDFLRQDVDDVTPFEEIESRLQAILAVEGAAKA
jgi:flagellum-specific ATP synthase